MGLTKVLICVYWVYDNIDMCASGFDQGLHAVTNVGIFFLLKSAIYFVVSIIIYT